MKHLLLGALVAGAITLAGCQSTPEDMESTEFVVTIAVNSDAPTPLAPVAWAVHTGSNPFVVGDMGRLSGLEALAEDGNPAPVDATLGNLDDVVAHGIANTPDGAASPGPAGPGTAYSFTVKAHEGERLSFATMYVQSNDLFYSPGNDGLTLFDMSAPLEGDVTSRIHLYDAGTEVNEAPGAGPNQPPRQRGPDTGPSEDRPVKRIGETMDGFTYPETSAVITVTVSPGMM